MGYPRFSSVFSFPLDFFLFFDTAPLILQGSPAPLFKIVLIYFNYLKGERKHIKVLARKKLHLDILDIIGFLGLNVAL